MWQKKRVIVTPEIIAVGRIDDDSETLLDAIPFVDVESVREFHGTDEAHLEKGSKDCLNAFMITTVPGGHNSGRTYYFQTNSSESYDVITRHLQSNAKTARKQAEFKTRFTKSQYQMRKYPTISWYQCRTLTFTKAIVTQFLYRRPGPISSS